MGALAAAVATLVLAGIASVAPARPIATPAGDAATVVLSDDQAGARPAAWTIAFTSELQCGRLRGNTVRLELPALARLPHLIRPQAVLVGGLRAGRVAVAGHALEIRLRPPRGAVCDVIAPGRTKIVLTRAAKIGNPRAPGRYVLVVRYAGGVARGIVNVRG